jgi:hypothetical protein
MKRSILLFAAAAVVPGCQAPESSIPSTTLVPIRPTAAVVFTSNAWAGSAGAPREIYTVDGDGTALTRVSFCNSEAQACDNVEAAPAPDGRRLAVRRILDPTVGERIFILDTARGVEGEITPEVPANTPTFSAPTSRASSIDWSPVDDLLVYSGQVGDALPDLYRTIPRPDPGGAQTGPLTATPTAREGGVRIDPTGSVAVFDRNEPGARSFVYVFYSGASQVQVSSGGPAGGPLPGTPYLVGSDADPDYSPDGQSIVFRRLTSTGNGGRGTWDLMVVRTDGSGLAPLVTGPVYRGAPDWGARGIVFAEIDAVAGTARLVVVDGTGGNARTLHSTSGFLEISHPRWLR